MFGLSKEKLKPLALALARFQMKLILFGGVGRANEIKFSHWEVVGDKIKPVWSWLHSMGYIWNVDVKLEDLIDLAWLSDLDLTITAANPWLTPPAELIKKATHIKKLTLNIKLYNLDEYRDLNDFSINKELEELNLYCASFVTGATLYRTIDLINMVTNLRTLALYMRLCSARVLAGLKIMPKLEHLYIKETSITPRNFVKLIKKCPNLKDLRLYCVRGLSNLTLNKIQNIEQLYKLEHFFVYDCDMPLPVFVTIFKNTKEPYSKYDTLSSRLYVPVGGGHPALAYVAKKLLKDSINKITKWDVQNIFESALSGICKLEIYCTLAEKRKDLLTDYEIRQVVIRVVIPLLEGYYLMQLENHRLQDWGGRYLPDAAAEKVMTFLFSSGTKKDNQQRIKQSLERYLDEPPARPRPTS